MEPIVYIVESRPAPGGVQFDINAEGAGRLHLRFYLLADLSHDIPTNVELEIIECPGGIRYRDGDLGMVVPEGRRLVKVKIPEYVQRGQRVGVTASVEPWSLLDEIAEASR